MSFFEKHPYLTILLVPAVSYGVYRAIRAAARGQADPLEDSDAPPAGPTPPGAASAMADTWRLPLSAQPLTPIRAQALQVLKDVLPAQNGGAGKLQANADAIGAGDAQVWSEMKAKNPAVSYSNCGSLPGYMSRMLGLADNGTNNAVDGVRSKARARGAWVDAAPGLPVLPKPGDIYGLSEGPKSILTHVGIIVDIERNPDGTYTLTTADSGQGSMPNWSAGFVTRTLDISGPRSTYLGRTRYLAGWADIERWG